MIAAKVIGIPDMRSALTAVPGKLRRRALGIALRAAGVVVRTRARTLVPVLSPAAPSVLKGLRKPGTVKKALSVRSSKIDRRAGDVGVFVSVRPLKKGQRGASNPNDPFYWRFVEFDTERNRGGARFLTRSADSLPGALDAFNRSLVPAINRLNTPKAAP